MSKAKNKEVLAANGVVVVSKDTKKENEMSKAKGIKVEVLVDDVKGEVDVQSVQNVKVDGQAVEAAPVLGAEVKGGTKIMTKVEYIAGMKKISEHIEGMTVAEALPYLVRIAHGAIQMVIFMKPADKKYAIEKEVINIIESNGLFPTSVVDQLNAVCPGQWKNASQIFFDLHSQTVMFQKDRYGNQVVFYGSSVGKNKKGQTYKDATRFWRLSVPKEERVSKTVNKEVMNG